MALWKLPLLMMVLLMLTVWEPLGVASSPTASSRPCHHAHGQPTNNRQQPRPTQYDNRPSPGRPLARHVVDDDDEERQKKNPRFPNLPQHGTVNSPNLNYIYPNDPFYDKQDIESSSTDYEDYEEIMEDLLLLRKCCGKGEYFNIGNQRCEPTRGDTGFLGSVKELPTENVTRPIDYVTGLLETCFESRDLPDIAEVTPHTHVILTNGELKDQVLGIVYDVNHYCLERSAFSPQELPGASLVAVYCHPWPRELPTRKCCEIDQYYDYELNECRQSNASATGEEEDFAHHFFGSNPQYTSVSLTTGRLKCDRGEPSLVVASETFISAEKKLCERKTGLCYSTSRYCIEEVWKKGDAAVTLLAAVCPHDTFHKCCPNNYFLTDAGCMLSPKTSKSARLKKLIKTRKPAIGFPITDGTKTCTRTVVELDSQDTRWRTSSSGLLSVDTTYSRAETHRYCLDDFINPNHTTDTIAIVCEEDLQPTTSYKV